MEGAPNEIIDKLKYVAKLIFNLDKKNNFIFSENFLKIAAKNLSDIAILIPPKRDINDSRFLSRLKHYNPDTALVIGCPQKFSKELLKIFNQAVNYHNSLLPKYRGLNATAFSVYYGEKKTGFTFHLMNKIFDGGNILIQDSIPIDDSSIAELELKKTIRASKKIRDVVDYTLINKRGFPQEGEKSYFGAKAWEEHVTVYDPKLLNPEELRKKLKCFGCLRLPYKGKLVEVTHAHFYSSHLKLKRINYLPIWLYRTYAFIFKR